MSSFLGTRSDPDHLLWVATSDRYFTVIVRPLPSPGAKQEILESGEKIQFVDYLD